MDIYTQGCVQGFGKWLQRHAVVIGAVFTGVVVPQVNLISVLLRGRNVLLDSKMLFLTNCFALQTHLPIKG